MSVTTTQVGTYTTQITLSGEQTPANFITSLDAAIVNAGWAQLDVTNQYNRIYNCLNADGVTSKIIGIFIDPGTLKINTTSYESWNTTTHVGTNEVWTYNRAGTMGFALSGCDVILMASPRWLVLQTFIRAQPSCWSGVFEVARELPEDTAAAGYPCWVWTSSATIFALPNNTSLSVSFPRTHTGLIGQAAAINTTLQTAYGRFGSSTYFGQAFSALANMVQYGWDQTKKIVQGIRPAVGATELHGRIFGLKATYNLGNSFNRVSIPVDTNFNFSATGTNTEHWLLNANPTTGPTNISVTSLTNGLPTGLINQSTQTSTITSQPNSTCLVNQSMYVATITGVYKADISGTTPGTITTVVGVPSVVCHGIVYDNYQYVYVAAPTGIYKIDTLNNDNTTFLATSASGVSVVYWDGTYLWASQRGNATGPLLYQINVSTFTIAQSITVVATAQQICSICSDFQGNTYVGLATQGIYKIANSTGTVTNLKAVTSGVNAHGMMFNGVNLVIGIWSGVSVQFYTYSTTGTLLVTGAALGQGSSYSGNSMNTLQVFKYNAYDALSGSTGNGSAGLVLDLSTTIPTYTFGNTAYPISNAAAFDGNRMVWASTNTFGMMTNIFHGDDGATAYGRLLLVK